MKVKVNSNEHYQTCQECCLEGSENRYKDLLMDFKNIQKILFETVEKTDELLKTDGNIDSRFLRAYLFFAYKTANLAESTIQLAKRGLVLGALILLRTTLYDNEMIRYLFRNRDKLLLWLKEQDIERSGARPSDEYLNIFKEYKMADFLERHGEKVGHQQISGRISKLVHGNPNGVTYLSKYDLSRMNGLDFDDMFIAITEWINSHMLELAALFLKEMDRSGVREEKFVYSLKQYYDKVCAYGELFEANQRIREKLKEEQIRYII